MPKTIKAIAIDVDDTLCLTEEACFELENAVLERIGRRPMSRSVHVRTWGRPLFEVITVRSPGVDVEAFRAAFIPMLTDYLAQGRMDVILPENYAALDTLIGLGKQIMLLTSRTHIEMEHMLEPDHLLAQKVTAFYHKDNTGYHKPDPRAFDRLLKEHRLPPDACVYVGDSLTDAEASNQAGLHFVASIESGLRQMSDFAAYRVDAYIQRFPDIVDAIAVIESK